MQQKSKVNRIVLVILVLVVSSFFHFGATEKRFDCPVVVFKKSVLKTKIQMIKSRKRRLYIQIILIPKIINQIILKTRIVILSKKIAA